MGSTLCAGTGTKGTAVDQWVERGEGRWPRQHYVPRAMTWGSAAGRLRHPGLWGPMPSDPAELRVGEAVGRGPGACSGNPAGGRGLQGGHQQTVRGSAGREGHLEEEGEFLPSLILPGLLPGMSRSCGTGCWACLFCARSRAWGLSGHLSLPPSPRDTSSQWATSPPLSSPPSGSQQSPLLHPGQEQPPLRWHEHRSQHLR